MKIDLWTDIVCPFCYIGNVQFNKSLNAFAHKAEVEVIHHSFQLMPEAPAKYDDKKSHETLAAIKGIPVAAAEEMNERVRLLGKQEGLDMKMADTKLVNSFMSHRFIHYAATKKKQETAVDALFEAYFTDTVDIMDIEALIGVAKKIGLDEGEVRQVLESEAFNDEVKADIHQAAELGIHGVPFFVIDGKYGVSGAQGVEAFSAILEKIWHEKHPLRMVGSAEAGNVCTDEACS